MKFIAKFAVREAEQSPSARRARIEIKLCSGNSTITTSPSARRARIEMYAARDADVALRKEGAD